MDNTTLAVTFGLGTIIGIFAGILLEARFELGQKVATSKADLVEMDPSEKPKTVPSTVEMGITRPSGSVESGKTAYSSAYSQKDDSQEVEEEDRNEPVKITNSEYLNQKLWYTKVECTYLINRNSGKSELINDEDGALMNVENTLGKRFANMPLDEFIAEFDADENLHVRNDFKGCDYEISLDYE